MRTATDASILESGLVSQHVEFLNAVAADHAAFRDLTNGIVRSMGEVAAALNAASLNDRSADATRQWIAGECDAALPMLAQTSGLIDRLQHCATVGVRIAGDLSILEQRLLHADIAVADAKRAYDDAALLENVPVLDAVERWARRPVEQAYDEYRAATAVREGVIEDLRMITNEWLTILPAQLGGAVVSPSGLKPSETEYAKWKNATTSDVSKNVNDGVQRSLWKSASVGTDEVIQGYLGDCYFCAAIAALASTPTGMRYLRSMIVDNGDGTYTVTFGNGRSETVTSDVATYRSDGSLDVAAQVAADGAFWFVILEKAYAALKGSYHDIGDGTHRATDVFADFGLGGSTTTVSRFTADATLQPLLDRANAGVPVTAGGRVGNILQSMGADAGDGHEFSVLSYDPDKQLVTLRNPWGTNSGHTPYGAVSTNGDADGVFTLRLVDFKREFSDVTVAGRAPG